MIYFVHLLVLWEIILPTDIFCYLCTYLWWPNLYTYLLLVTHSVQPDYFEGLILYTYFLMFDLFSISTTYSWPSLYNSDFMSYLVYLLLLGKFTYTCGILRHTPLVTYSVNISHLCETNDSVHMEVVDGLFCTHTSQYSLHILWL